MRDRGAYRYFKDDVLSDVTETFRIEGTPGRVVVASERSAPAFGMHLRVEARGATWTGPFSAVDIQLTRTSAPHSAEASYRIVGPLLEWTRRIDGVTDEGRQTLGEDTLIYPLMRVFLGPVITEAAHRGRANVLTPWITDPTNVSRLLLPHIEEREASEVLHRGNSPLRRFTFLSAQYDRDAQFDLDADGLLVRYVYPQKDVGIWRVDLAAQEDSQ